MAGLEYIGKDRINKLLNELQNRGLIYQERSKVKDVLRIEIKFVGIDTDDIVAYLVEKDYMYPEHIYLKHFTKTRFIDCEKCGDETIAGSNRAKYCKACKKKVKLEQERERISKIKELADNRKIEIVQKAI